MLLFLFFLLIIVVFIIISLFAFPQLSPIPYFPTNKKDLPLIIKALLPIASEPDRFRTIIDLGAGDGIVIFEAAKKAYQEKLNIQFVAVEINPVLILILHLRRLFHPNKKNIKIIWGDMFKFNFQTFLYGQGNALSLPTFYLYISPWFLEKVAEEIKTQISNFKIISYMYKIPLWEKRLRKILSGKNKIFVYQ